MADAPELPPDINRGPEILATCGSLVGISVVIVMMRMYVRARIVRLVGWDDWCIVAATVVIFAEMMVILPEVEYGGGRHVQYIEPKENVVIGLHYNFVTQPLDKLISHPVPSGADDEEKWFLMWDILFPGIPRPSSPYVTAQEGEGLFRSFADFATSQFSQRLSESDRLNAEQARHVLDILGEVFEGGVGTQALSRAAVTPAPPSNHLPPPTLQQRHHNTPNTEVHDVHVTGLSPSPIPATETGGFNTPMQYPVTFGGLPLDHPSNPRFPDRANPQYENQHALSPTPAATRSSQVEDHRAHRRRGRARTRAINNMMLVSTPSDTASMSQQMYPMQSSNQYPLTPPGGGYAPNPQIHLGSLATPPYAHFPPPYPRQQYPYFNPYQPNTPQGYPTNNMGHEHLPNPYSESLVNQAHGLSPPPFLYSGFNSQNNQMQPQTGFRHQGHSHRQIGNEQRRAQHNEGPVTTPGQNMVGAIGLQVFSNPQSLHRLHMTGASAHIPESASTGSVPDEMETDYQHGAAQNEMSDNSQSGSPSDVFRDLNYSSEPGGG
ncbi:integral membrane family protein [Colletotrichum kahawae]|uniref:Integral membrane family protein n=1 Tax=Colletotrichum kahawae TaxID=34407 RepID=A0AAD9YBM7_COLKA|nr:integral membrane family protein [Colletotrichum kahawae]